MGFATSRAQSMKSCATGVSVRFFNVMALSGTSRAKSKMRFGRSPRLDLVPDGFSNQTKARYNRSLMP